MGGKVERDRGPGNRDQGIGIILPGIAKVRPLLFKKAQSYNSGKGDAMRLLAIFSATCLLCGIACNGPTPARPASQRVRSSTATQSSELTLTQQRLREVSSTNPAPGAPGLPFWPQMEPKHVVSVVTRDDKECVAVDGRAGKGYDSIWGNPVSAGDGDHVAYVAMAGGAFRVVLDDVEGPEHPAINAGSIALTEDAAHLTYTCQSGDKTQMVIDGQVLPPYDSVSNVRWTPRKNRCVYIAREGEKAWVFVDGARGPEFRNAAIQRFDLYHDSEVNGLVFSPDESRLAYTVQDGGRGGTFVIMDGKLSERYDSASIPRFYSDGRHVMYGARNGTVDMIVRDGETIARYDTKDFGPHAYQSIVSSFPHIVVHQWREGDHVRRIIVDGVISEFTCDHLDGPVFDSTSQHVAWQCSEKGRAWVLVDGVKGPDFDSMLSPTFRFIAPEDGKHYVYTAYRGKTQVHIIDGKEIADTKGIISISPDLRRVAYAVKQGDKVVVIADGKAGQRVDKTQYQAAFSPDSRHLAYWAQVGDKQCVVLDGELGPAWDNIRSQDVCFLPDGSLAYQAVRDGWLYQVRYGPAQQSATTEPGRPAPAAAAAALKAIRLPLPPPPPWPASQPATMPTTAPAREDIAGWLALVAPPGLKAEEYRKRAQELLKLCANSKEIVFSEFPAEMDPYGEHGQAVWHSGGPPPEQNLFLHPNGMPDTLLIPGGFEKARMYYGGRRGSPLRVQWYPDGRPMLVEHWTQAGLRWGMYYDNTGHLLSSVRDGLGLALEMSPTGKVLSAQQFAGGVLHGRVVHAVTCELYRQGAVKIPQYTAAPPAGVLPKGVVVEADVPPSFTCRAYSAADRQKAANWQWARAKWDELAKDKDFTPMGLAEAGPKTALVWGWAATKTPEKGIPNRIAISRDGGTTWTSISAPAAVLTKAEVTPEGNIEAIGPLLPRQALAQGAHWAYHRKWSFISEDGRSWIRLGWGDGSSGVMVKSSLASPAGIGTLYFVQTSGYHQPTQDYVEFSPSLLQAPRNLFGGYGRGKFTAAWSQDGKQVLVSREDGSTLTIDPMTGEEIKPK